MPASREMADDKFTLAQPEASTPREAQTHQALGRGRRLRFKKASIEDRKRSWQTEEESVLGQVLAEERQAWLNQSTSDIDQDSNSEVDAAHDKSLSCRSTLAQDHGTALTEQDPEGTTPLARPKIITRRSMFLEGSMNEASRATASTWDESAITRAPSSSYSEKTLVDRDDDSQATPRTSLSSRASFSSSIDINEFKPLPATPSTFTTTIKRFGQILKPGQGNVDQSTVRARAPATKPPKRGLRKSMSTWKIFNSSISEVDEDSPEFPPREDLNATIKRSTRMTLKPKSRVKTVAASANDQKQLLDERKRKAEIAYAEQFGTVKRHKQVASGEKSSTMTKEVPEPATVRRTDRLTAASSVSANKDSDASVASTSIRPVEPPQLMQDTCHQHPRPSSRNSNTSIESETDRLKRVSRTELEKENQQLRAMLREKEKPDQNTINRSPTRLKRSRASLERDPSLADSNWQIFEYDPPATIKRRTGPIVQASEDAPPMPSLPTGVQTSSTILAPLNNITTLPRPIDASTVKRYAGQQPPGRMLEVPRSLSMVLEAGEDENENDEEKDCDDASRKNSPGRKESQYDGACENDGNDEFKKVAGCMTVGGGKWDWPEDVF